MNIDTLMNSAILYQQFDTTNSDGYFVSTYASMYPSYAICLNSNKRFNYKTQITLATKIGYKPDESANLLLLTEGSVVGGFVSPACYITDSNNTTSDSFTFFGQTITSSFFILNNVYSIVISYDNINKNGYYSIHNQTLDTWLFGVLTNSYSWSTKKDTQLQVNITGNSDGSSLSRIYAVGLWNQMLTNKDHINLIKQMEI